MFCHLEYKPEENPSVGMDYPGRMETKTTGWCDMISTCSTNMERFVWIDFDIWCPVISLTIDHVIHSIFGHTWNTPTAPSMSVASCPPTTDHQQVHGPGVANAKAPTPQFQVVGVMKIQPSKGTNQSFFNGAHLNKKKNKFHTRGQSWKCKWFESKKMNWRNWGTTDKTEQTSRVPYDPTQFAKAAFGCLLWRHPVSKSSATRSTWATSSSARNPANHIQNRLNTSFLKVECLRQ